MFRKAAAEQQRTEVELEGRKSPTGARGMKGRGVAGGV